MNMNRRVLAAAVSVLPLLGFATLAQAGTITTFSNLGAFNAAVGGGQTVEDFTDTTHIPISTGVLNSATNLPGIGITPGTIQPGVTYSVPVGAGFFFNIDAGGGFPTPFLDTITGAGPLTVTFDSSTGAFGFLTSVLMGSTLNITINFVTGPSFVSALPIGGDISTLQFFGFQSSGVDITSALIGTSGTGITWAVDDFRFSAEPGPAVPEPGTMVLIGSGLLGLAARRRRS